jgi:hypothetical protein
LLDHGVPLVALHVETDRRALRRPLPLRGDLRELEFSAPSRPEHAGEG